MLQNKEVIHKTRIKIICSSTSIKCQMTSLKLKTKNPDAERLLDVREEVVFISTSDAYIICFLVCYITDCFLFKMSI